MTSHPRRPPTTPANAGAEPHPDGGVALRYRAALIVAWGDRKSHPTRYTFYLPADVRIRGLLFLFLLCFSLLPFGNQEPRRARRFRADVESLFIKLPRFAFVEFGHVHLHVITIIGYASLDSFFTESDVFEEKIVLQYIDFRR